MIWCIFDPPYWDTVEYAAHKETFDHAQFWGWCEEQVRNDVLVVVSESTRPISGNWTQVWWVEREINITKQDGQLPGTIFDALYVPEWLAGRAESLVE